MNELQKEYIYQEIQEQGEIARLILSKPRPSWPGARRTILAGAGDSLAAAELVAALYPERRATALPILAASEEARKIGPQDALIAISVSGRTTRALEAAKRAHQQKATVIGITDDPSSPLAEEADEVWLIGASPPTALTQTNYTDEAAQQYVGYHHDVAQTKSFVAVVLTLAQAARPASDPDEDDLPESINSLLSSSFFLPIKAPAESLAEATQSFFLGSLAGFPMARYSAYKMFEYNRLAHFSDIEEYCHTQYFITREGDGVVLLVPDLASSHRAQEISPVLQELFGDRILWIRSSAVEPCVGMDSEIVVPAGRTLLSNTLGFVLAIQWLTYFWGRVGAPDINTFHAGYDTERLVGASLRTIRQSRIRLE